MNSIKDWYIYMPRNDKEYKHMVREYTARGWDQCPTMYKNMLKDKEGFCLIAYEVVCNCCKFIQSVLVGHPGTRNDKHIVRTVNTVM